MKHFWHKLNNWEYWPVYVIYFPAFFLWIYWIIYFRSFKFYKHANPNIKNGGLYGDSKMEIYKILPQELYPKTLLITKNNRHNAVEMIRLNNFEYPLIVKPDIGLRGFRVEKIYNDFELKIYVKTINQDFLVQIFISFPNEIGLFYYRFPNEKDGKISGITLKNFLIIKGNGIDTIIQLLMKKHRFKFQIAKLKKTNNLKEILAKNEQSCLVPFGNHSRGTEFQNGNKFISERLHHTFNKFLKDIDGFYYGRLDIKFNTFEELEIGKNFSIIELNGVKSEPTHIYDPKHSFWYGQKEIFRHQIIMKKIVKENLQLLKRGYYSSD